MKKNNLSLEQRIAIIKTDIKWIKWLLGIEIPLLFALIITVAKLAIG